MGSKKWRVRVWCMTASYNYNEVAPNEEIAIENVRSRVMTDMKGWNFSASLADDSDNGSFEKTFDRVD